MSTFGTLSFDLTGGLVRIDEENRLVVPVTALIALFRTASPKGRKAFGRAMGEAIGHVASSRLANQAEMPHALVDASPALALSELSAAWALAGLGALDMERWGKALLLVVAASPLGEEGDELCETMLESALIAATDKPVRVAWIERKESLARFFVGSQAATEQMRTELERGTSWAEALRRLQGDRE